MDLPGESEPRRRRGRRNPAVITRRNPPVDTMYAVGIICLQEEADIFDVVVSPWCHVRADEDLRRVLFVPSYSCSASSSRMEGKGYTLPEGLDNSVCRRRPTAVWLLASCGADGGPDR
ncbi:Amiloride-sensitive sodium channel subunit alpha [Dissostichus eleginoides]|uniref:Amiloride-sensitive sodium channel subunit alpha n=1 Tax=Dissostichus eleginoides TaxID=100907 RepID=A0AAD9CR22_DISEL|nr:Amiloride-sensitive sodium channel subunit alpha [Dissostichus eleginoides]